MATSTDTSYAGLIGVPLQAGKKYWQRLKGQAQALGAATGGLSVETLPTFIYGQAQASSAATGDLEVSSPSVSLSGDAVAVSQATGEFDFWPTFSTIPSVTFVNGTASTFPLGGYFREGGHGTSTLSLLGDLPPQVSYNATTKALVYTPSAGDDTSEAFSVRMQADDGYQSYTLLNTSFEVTAEAGGIVPITLGYAVPQGALPAGSSLYSPDVELQGYVRATWSDGSAKIVTVSLIPTLPDTTTTTTTLTGPGTSVTVADASLIAVGDPIAVGMNDLGYHYATVTAKAGNVLTFSGHPVENSATSSYGTLAARTSSVGSKVMKRSSFRLARSTRAPTPITEAALIAANPQASITVTGYGTASLQSILSALVDFNATTPSATAWNHRQIISGHVMSSWVYRAPIGTDPHLSAWFEVRLYANGAINVWPWIEMTTMYIAGIANKTGQVTVSVGGAQVFDSNDPAWATTAQAGQTDPGMDLIIHPHTRLPLLAPTAYEGYWIGQADPQAFARPDTAYWRNSKVIPNHAWTNPTPLAFDMPSIYDQTSGWYDANDYKGGGRPVKKFVRVTSKVGTTNHRANMQLGGANPALGINPQWDGLFVGSGGDLRMFKCGLVNAVSLGTSAWHFRDEVTGLPARMNLDRTSIYSGNLPAAGTDAQSPDGELWDTPHAISAPFVQFVATGRVFFQEQILFMSNVVWARANGTHVKLTAGGGRIYDPCATGNELRGGAWAMRNMALACVASEELPFLAADYAGQWANNVEYYYDNFIVGSAPVGKYSMTATETLNPDGMHSGVYAQAGNIFGIMHGMVSGAMTPEQVLSTYGTSPIPGVTISFQNNYMAAMLGYASDLEPSKITDTKDKLVAVRNYAYKVVKGISGTADGGWPWPYMGLYYARVCRQPMLDSAGNLTTTFWGASWADAFDIAWNDIEYGNSAYYLWYGTEYPHDPDLSFGARIYGTTITANPPTYLVSSETSPGRACYNPWSYMAMALSYAIDHGAVPMSVWNTLRAAPNCQWNSATHGFDDYQNHGIKPRSGV